MTSIEREILIKIYQILLSGRIDQAKKELEKFLSTHSNEKMK